MRYGNASSAMINFMTDNLYLEPPANLPCEHLDTPDMQCLNIIFAPVKHAFDNTMDIESHNVN